MSLRYLTENNDYEILYSHSKFQAQVKPDGYRIGAYLQDKQTGKINITSEKLLNNNLERCLMTLGKRLIRRWRNQKNRKK